MPQLGAVCVGDHQGSVQSGIDLASGTLGHLVVQKAGVVHTKGYQRRNGPNRSVCITSK